MSKYIARQIDPSSFTITENGITLHNQTPAKSFGEALAQLATQPAPPTIDHWQTIGTRDIPHVRVDLPTDNGPQAITIPVSRILASGDTNTKTRKNGGKGHESCGLSMSPHKLAGVGNVCTDASPACVRGCLNGTGLGAVFPTIQAARIARTFLWYSERSWFLDTLRSDLTKWQRKAEKQGLELCCRPNMFSDVLWEQHDIVDEFPRVQFYDYTKHPKRFDNGNLVRPNYWLTFSRSEVNDHHALDLLSRGCNVAVVFHELGKFTGNRAKYQRLPKTWNGFPVFDADIDDRRFTDPRGRTRGRVAGLRLKAPNNAQRQDMIDSGFSVLVR